MRYLKIDVRQENGVLSLECGQNRDVTNDVMFVYMCMRKTNILLSVLSIVSFFFYDFNPNTQGFVN